MKAIFYVLALLVTGAAAYFSYENLTKFEKEKEAKEKAIATNKVVSGNADKQQVALDEEKVKLEAANKDKADAEASIENLVAKEKTLRRDLGELEGLLEEQKAKFAELEKARAALQDLLKQAGDNVTLETIADTVKAMEDDKVAKTKKLAELETLVDAAKKAVEGNQAEIARLADRSASRDKRIAGNAMESVVSAVNDDWGFVIIGAGSNTGFTPQTKLLVKRDGRLIAEVKPSSIEPSQTIAEIDPETVAPGARIQPGDRVILANPATN